MAQEISLYAPTPTKTNNNRRLQAMKRQDVLTQLQEIFSYLFCIAQTNATHTKSAKKTEKLQTLNRLTHTFNQIITELKGE